MEIESCIYEWMEMASDSFDSMPFPGLGEIDAQTSNSQNILKNHNKIKRITNIEKLLRSNMEIVIMEDRAQKNVDGYSHIEHEEVTLIRMGKRGDIQN